jgi:hypothetical protein
VNSPKHSIKLFWVIAREDGSSSYLQYRELINIFTALKSYFLSLENCPVSLENFFENPLSFTPIYFLARQLKTVFHNMKCIEKQDTAISEVKNEISKLLDKLNSYNSYER